MADTYDLDPAVRIEEILNGDDIEPANRLEYFLKKAATEVPKPTSADAGKVVTVNEDGDGYILGEGGGGADIYIGTIITMAEVPPLPEGYIMADVYEEFTQNTPAPVYVCPSSDSANSSSNTTPVAYPSMQEVKPAFLKVYEEGNFGIVTTRSTIDFHTEMLYPLVEDISKNRAYLTLNTAVPIFTIDAGNANVLPIEKTNLKWVLCDPTLQ